jgi:hypothetical protein
VHDDIVDHGDRPRIGVHFNDRDVRRVPVRDAVVEAASIVGNLLDVIRVEPGGGLEREVDLGRESPRLEAAGLRDLSERA